ncbi:MAG TPA: PHB depolymerase family esterase [Gemmatimonadaceae bacterium]
MIARATILSATLPVLALQACASSTIRPGSEGVTSEQKMYVAGELRTYRLHIPAHYDTIRRAPLVVVLHGHGESAANFEKYTGMSEKADREGFIAVYPQAQGDPSDWHTAIDGPRKRDDIAFVRDIINLLEHKYRIDDRRIYAAGHSNGGIMTYRLASTLSDKLAAIGVTAGSIGMVDEHGDTLRIAPPAHPVSVIHFHGLADPSVPYAGGPESDGPDNIISVKNTISFWISADHCKPAPVSRTVSADKNVIIEMYGPCAKGTAVVLYTIIDGTHRWPGDEVPWYTFPGRDDSDVVATDVMWDFFAAHPRVQ